MDYLLWWVMNARSETFGKYLDLIIGIQWWLNERKLVEVGAALDKLKVVVEVSNIQGNI